MNERIVNKDNLRSHEMLTKNSPFNDYLILKSGLISYFAS